LSNHATLNLINRRYIANRPCPEMQGQDQRYRTYWTLHLLTRATRLELSWSVELSTVRLQLTYLAGALHGQACCVFRSLLDTQFGFS